MADKNKSTSASPAHSSSINSNSGSSNNNSNNNNASGGGGIGGSPDADPNSSIIHKVRSRMSSILPSTISSWFSPSGRNGRRRRSNDSDDSVVEPPAPLAVASSSAARTHRNGTGGIATAAAASTSAAAADADSADAHRGTSSWVIGVPPTKRQKFVASTDEISFARDIGNIPFTYSTPAAPSATVLAKRRTIATSIPSTPYQFHLDSSINQRKRTQPSAASAKPFVFRRGQQQSQFVAPLNGDETTEDEDAEVQRPKPSAKKWLNAIPLDDTPRDGDDDDADRNAAGEDSNDDDEDDEDEEDNEDDDDDDEEIDLELNGLGQQDESTSESSNSFVAAANKHKLKASRQSTSAVAAAVAAASARSASDILAADQQRRRLSVGLFSTASPSSTSSAAAKMVAAAAANSPANSTALNFNAHLQTHKSLFSTPGQPGGVGGSRSASLNASTTSLNSLTLSHANANRRRSALYGSTSALSDSRLLSGGAGGAGTHSPFYNGRTMYGGAAAYSSQRRAQSSQRTLRIPTQMRPASSLSGASSQHTKSPAPMAVGGGGFASASGEQLAGAGLQTSALSNTAKRILDLMNQFSTPLGDVRKMAGGGGSQTLPSLVAHRRRFDESDMLANRGVRLNRPHTPYTRQVPIVQPQQPATSSMATELQVPTMSSLMQMKKVLQNKTERFRELASSSNSFLNRNETAAAKPPAVYSLPAGNAGSNATNNSSGTAAQSTAPLNNATTSNEPATGCSNSGKIRNKITSTRVSARNTLNETLPEPVNLPSVQLGGLVAGSMPSFDFGTVPFGKPSATASAASSSIFGGIQSSAASKQTSNSFASSKSPQTPPANHTSPAKPFSFAGVSPAKATSATFTFSAPLAVCAPAFAATVAPIANFQFSRPLNVLDGAANSTTTTTPKKANTGDSSLTSPAVVPSVALKTGSVLDALKKTEPLPWLSSVATKQSSQWECDSCMLHNESTRPRCVACESPKPSAVAAVAATKSAPSLAPTVASTSSAFASTSSFGSQFAPAAGTWECQACMLRNKADASKCVSCATAKAPPTKQTAATSATPFAAMPSSSFGSFGQQFKPAASTWECDACMVRNKSEAAKCVACESARPAAKVSSTATNSSAGSSFAPLAFGQQFKPAASTWECDACMVRNKSEAAKCVACESARPSAAGAKLLAHTISAPTSVSSFGGAAARPVDSGFASLVAKQSANRWECSACMTRNDAQRQRCECCELDRPGQAAAAKPATPFGNSAAALSLSAVGASKFSFGVAFDASAPAPAPLKTVNSGPAQFSFGAQPKAAVDSAAAAPKATFSFGSAPALNAASPPVDKDSSVASSSAAQSPPDTGRLSKADTVDASPSFGGFGAPASTDAKSAPTASGFGGISVGATAAAVSSSTIPSAITSSTFSFGGVSKAPELTANSNSTNTSSIQGIKPTAGFSFGSSASTSSPAVPAATVITGIAAAAKKPEFAFGSPSTGVPSFGGLKPTTTLANPDAGPAVSAMAATNGGFSFGLTASPAKPASTAAAPSMFGASSVSAATANATTSTFGTPATGATALSFGGAAQIAKPTAAPATASFVFGSAATASTIVPAVAAPTAGFGFGSSSAAVPAAQATTNPPMFSSSLFGAAASAAASASQSTTATANASNNTGASAFIFGSPAPAAATIQATATQGAPAPAFGQFQFGQTPAKPTATVPSTTFGGFGAPAASTAAASPFGGMAATAAAPATTAVTPFGFGAASSVQAPSMFAFGATASSANNATATTNSDEPLAKKMLGQMGTAQPSAFSFGAPTANSTTDAKTPFSFSASTPTSFNFSAQPQLQMQPNQQQSTTAPAYTFGTPSSLAASGASAAVFSFGSGSHETTPGTPFQFAAGDSASPNMFLPPTATNAAPGSSTANQNAIQQRRKVRAVRRNIR